MLLALARLHCGYRPLQRALSRFQARCFHGTLPISSCCEHCHVPFGSQLRPKSQGLGTRVLFQTPKWSSTPIWNAQVLVSHLAERSHQRVRPVKRVCFARTASVTVGSGTSAKKRLESDWQRLWRMTTMRSQAGTAWAILLVTPIFPSSR